MLFSKQIDTPLGTLHLCCDGKGLAKICLPGTKLPPEIIESQKSPCFPAVLELATQQLREYFEGKRTCFELPISLYGTDFQKRVWGIIRRIPYGQAMSYGEIALKLGGLEKARAVGGAAHANPLPLIIPCHRVIGAKGALVGFAGGIEMKKRLLAMEKLYRARQQ